MTSRVAQTIALVLVLLTSACDDSSSGRLVQVEGNLGVMDCPSDLYQYSISEIDETASGSGSPEEALQLLTSDMACLPAHPRWSRRQATQ